MIEYPGPRNCDSLQWSTSGEEEVGRAAARAGFDRRNAEVTVYWATNDLCSDARAAGRVHQRRKVPRHKLFDCRRVWTWRTRGDDDRDYHNPVRANWPRPQTGVVPTRAFTPGKCHDRAPNSHATVLCPVSGHARPPNATPIIDNAPTQQILTRHLIGAFDSQPDLDYDVH